MKAVYRRVLERDGYICRYCGAQLGRPEDYVTVGPLATPGGHCGCGEGAMDYATGIYICHGRCDSCEPFLALRPGVVQATVDHVLARARGGTDDPSNLVAACNPCNAKKGAR